MPLPIIPSGNVASATAGGYEVTNSCRFNSTDSAYMYKTLGTATNEKKFTFSAWVKRGLLSGDQTIFNVGPDGAAEWQTGIRFRAPSDYDLHCTFDDRGTATQLITSPEYKDPHAWYHVVFAVDTTQSTEANRMKLYVNGVQQNDDNTYVNVYPSQDTDCDAMDSGNTIAVGRRTSSTNMYFDGYMAEVCFVDGTAYAASDFGEFDEDSPTIWKPKNVSSLTFGNNGFYLDFEDSSNLGNDANGGTDLTESGIVAGDQSISTPTNFYNTLSPLQQYNSCTLSEGNTRFTGNAGSGSNDYTLCGSSFGVSKGKWYFEIKHAQTRSKLWMIACHDVLTTMLDDTDGFWFTTSPHNTGQSTFYLQAQNTNHATQRNYTVRKYVDTTQTTITSTGGNITDGMGVGILGIYLDLDNGRIHFYNNGVALDESDADDSAGGYGAIPAGYYSFAVGESRAPDAGDDGALLLDWNFGDPNSNITISSGNADANGYGNFEYNPTIGSVNYYAMNTKNLAEFG